MKAYSNNLLILPEEIKQKSQYSVPLDSERNYKRGKIISSGQECSLTPGTIVYYCNALCFINGYDVVCEKDVLCLGEDNE